MAVSYTTSGDVTRHATKNSPPTMSPSSSLQPSDLVATNELTPKFNWSAQRQAEPIVVLGQTSLQGRQASVFRGCACSAVAAAASSSEVYRHRSAPFGKYRRSSQGILIRAALPPLWISEIDLQSSIDNDLGAATSRPPDPRSTIASATPVGDDRLLDGVARRRDAVGTPSSRTYRNPFAARPARSPSGSGPGQ